MAITTFVLNDDNRGVNVEYKTDLGNGAADDEQFTIMEIVGLSDAEISEGMDFQQLPSNLPAFKDFAEAHSLRLLKYSSDGVETIVDYRDDSSSISIS